LVAGVKEEALGVCKVRGLDASHFVVEWERFREGEQKRGEENEGYVIGEFVQVRMRDN